MTTAAAETDIAANMRTPTPRQQESLPGIGIPEVEAAARKLRDHRIQRMAMQQQETPLAESLLAVMDEHKLTEFFFEEDGVKFRAKIKGKRKVSVTKVKPENDGDE